MFETTSFLSSPDEVIEPSERPVLGVASLELIDEAGARHALKPQFTSMISGILLALDSGKVVHVDVEEPLVTPDRAAVMLGVSRPTVYAWQDRGRLARIDQGNRRMVPTADIDRYKQELQQRIKWRSTIEAPEPDDQAVT